MSKQQAFDDVVNHLRKQGKQSYDADTEMCRYRGPDGMKCAIGAVIPDELYSYDMEGWGLAAGQLEHIDRYLKSIYGFDDFVFWDTLQTIHDGEVEDWERKFQHFANAHGLFYTPPQS